MSPKITALFKRIAREKSFTDEMIAILPSQGEHCIGLARESGHAGRDQFGPSLPPLCGLSWQEKVLVARGALAWHVVAFALLNFIPGLSVLGAKWD